VMIADPQVKVIVVFPTRLKGVVKTGVFPVVLPEAVVTPELTPPPVPVLPEEKVVNPVP